MTSLSGATLVPTFEEDNGSGLRDEKEGLETCGLCTEPHQMSELQSTEHKISEQEAILVHDGKDFPFSIVSSNSDHFKQFDILDNCSDRHFIDEGKGLALSQVKRGWLKKVQQEWSILDKNLPETIYVFGFEERMDHLRAAIVGACGTPCHDGLFFFDIFFPPEWCITILVGYD